VRFHWSLASAGACALLGLAHCSLVGPLDGLAGGGTDTDAGDDAADALSSDTTGDTTPATGDGAHVDAPADAPTSTDGVGATGDGPAAHDAPADAAADAADAAADTAPDTAPTSDGPSPSDAAPDAIDAGPTVLFHDDFEGAAALPRAWDTMTTDGGALALSHAVSVSPTTSLSAKSFALDAAAPGNSVAVALRKAFSVPPSGRTIAYDFQVLPQQVDPAGFDAVVGALQLGDAAGDLYELQLDVHQASPGLTVTFAEYTGLADGGSSYIGHPVPTTSQLTTGVWTDVRIELTFSQPPIARVYFAGAPTPVLETTVAFGVVPSKVQLSLGLSYVRPGSATWSVFYDDVYYELSP
jgi:hypothetical protein